MQKFLSIKITGKTEAQAALRRYGVDVMAALLTKTQDLTLRLQRHVVEDKLSGQVLHVRTGNLRRSIQQEVTVEGYTIRGRVYSSGDVKYAGIHEFGGVIHMPPREFKVRLRTTRAGDLMRQSAIDRIGPYRPRAAHALANAAVFAKASHKMAVEREVSHSGYVINMPERSYLRSSLADMAKVIATELKDAALQAAGVI